MKSYRSESIEMPVYLMPVSKTMTFPKSVKITGFQINQLLNTANVSGDSLASYNLFADGESVWNGNILNYNSSYVGEKMVHFTRPFVCRRLEMRVTDSGTQDAIRPYNLTWLVEYENETRP